MTTTHLDPHPGTAASLLRGMRPKQWVKNLLVVAAPLAAGKITEPDVLTATLAGFGSFCLASSAVYLVNDTVDVEADRLHPVKRHRPVAAGHLSPRLALSAAGVLAAGSLALAATTGLPLVVLMVFYLGLQVAYSVELKNHAVLDIAVIAGGFLLRAVAGGVAASLPISQWFLLVAGFGSLFIVAGKRFSEIRTLGHDGETRRSLAMYTESYLRYIWGVATAVTIMSYSLWAFREPEVAGVPWHALSIAPFVLAMMRYAIDIDAGRAGDPEDIVWHDRILQLLGLLWLVLAVMGVMGV